MSCQSPLTRIITRRIRFGRFRNWSLRNNWLRFRFRVGVAISGTPKSVLLLFTVALKMSSAVMWVLKPISAGRICMYLGFQQWISVLVSLSLWLFHLLMWACIWCSSVVRLLSEVTRCLKTWLKNEWDRLCNETLSFPGKHGPDSVLHNDPFTSYWQQIML